MMQRALRDKLHTANNLFRFSVKRTVGLTVLVTIFIMLICPGYTVSCINRELGYRIISDGMLSSYKYDFSEMCPALTVIITVATTIAALIYLYVNFAFLYSRSSADFYHALPLKRTGLLFSRFAASIVPIFVPITVAYLSMLGICGMKNVTGDVRCILLGYVSNLIITLACCAIMLLFVVCAGSVFDLIISSLTFNIGVVLIALIMNGFCESFLRGFPASDFSGLIESVSPVYYMFMRQYLLLISFESSSAVLYVTVFLKVMLIAVASLVVSLLLYNRRRSEKSGIGYAYRFMYTICAFVVGIIGAYALGFIFSDGDYENIMYWIFVPVGGALSVITFGAISDKGFKNVKKSLATAAGSVIALCLAVVIMYTGAFGYSERIPGEGDIQSATVEIDNRKITFDDPTEVLSLHKMLITPDENADCYFGRIAIKYDLKNGKTVYREYIDYYDGNSKEVLDIVRSREFRLALKERFSSLTTQEVDFYSHCDEENNWTGLDESFRVYMTAAELNALVDAYISDLANATGAVLNGDNVLTVEMVLDDDSGRTAWEHIYIEESFENTLSYIKGLSLAKRVEFE